jgi:hypothetical protein
MIPEVLIISSMVFEDMGAIFHFERISEAHHIQYVYRYPLPFYSIAFNSVA